MSPSLFKLLLSLLVVAASKIHAVHGGKRLTEFVLPERSEGITKGPGDTIFVSQIKTGGVLSVNVMSGKIKGVVSDQKKGRQAWGMSY